MVAVPPAMPVTMPLPEPTMATAALLLLHVPTPDASLSVIVEVAHSGSLPLIAPEAVVTVTTVVAAQPDVTL